MHILLTAILASVSLTAHAGDPLTRLRTEAPALYQLHQSSPEYHKVFTDYANQQNYRRPIENLATVIHELIHVTSATHNGYYIDGQYYEPYLTRVAWPMLTNKDIRHLITDREQSPISRFYVPNTPNNHLGNVVDEINAHEHVLTFVCKNEPESADKQISNLLGHLHLQEVYLRALRTTAAIDYNKLKTSKTTRGALSTITQRAWTALHACGVPDARVPAQEIQTLLR